MNSNYGNKMPHPLFNPHRYDGLAIRWNCKLFLLKEVDGDGNCFYRSICKHPYFSNQGITHEILREDAVARLSSLIRNDKELEKDLRSCVSKYSDPSNHDRDTLEKCILEMGTDKKEAGMFEMVSLMVIYKINIICLMADVQKTNASSSLILRNMSEFDIITDILGMPTIEKQYRPSKNYNVYILHHAFTCAMEANIDNNHYLYLLEIDPNQSNGLTIINEEAHDTRKKLQMKVARSMAGQFQREIIKIKDRKRKRNISKKLSTQESRARDAQRKRTPENRARDAQRKRTPQNRARDAQRKRTPQNRARDAQRKRTPQNRARDVQRKRKAPSTQESRARDAQRKRNC
ncbi:predicted protein [Chaetoceros tenuissimus]|uniref:OTU domain-containing protein n=1 Tax=Chaetoceros tenuissimus TaxID=426638 RepID=A0AAD3CQS0_9STRA|nr:predicted protein [Chaetoceros tenuissimus]